MSARLHTTEGQVAGLLARVDGAENKVEQLEAANTAERIEDLEKTVLILQNELVAIKNDVALEDLRAKVASMAVRMDGMAEQGQTDSETTRAIVDQITRGEARFVGLKSQFEAVRRDVHRHNQAESERLAIQAQSSARNLELDEQVANRARTAKAIIAHPDASRWSTRELEGGSATAGESEGGHHDASMDGGEGIENAGALGDGDAVPHGIDVDQVYHSEQTAVITATGAPSAGGSMAP